MILRRCGPISPTWSVPRCSPDKPGTQLQITTATEGTPAYSPAPSDVVVLHGFTKGRANRREASNRRTDGRQ